MAFDELFYLPGPDADMKVSFPDTETNQSKAWRKQLLRRIESASKQVLPTSNLSLFDFKSTHILPGLPSRQSYLKSLLVDLTGCSFFQQQLNVFGYGPVSPEGRQLLNEIDHFAGIANTLEAREALEKVFHRTLTRLVNDRVLRTVAARYRGQGVNYDSIEVEDILTKFLSMSNKAHWREQTQALVTDEMIAECVGNLAKQLQNLRNLNRLFM